jgi:Cu+-exporting ATPase
VQTYTLAITGMHCASCGIRIDDALEDLPGVARAQTSVRTGRSTVTVDPTQVTLDRVLAAVRDAGYTAREVTP